MKGISVFICAVLILIGAGAANAIPITPVGVVASSTHQNYNENDLINNSGLDATGFHNQNFQNMWMSDQSVGFGTLTFDLGREYSIISADIWQYNLKGSNLPRGVQYFNISSAPNNGNFSPVLGNAYLEIAPQSPLLIAAQNVSFGQEVMKARWVKFDILSNYGFMDPSSGRSFTGLSEVKFNGGNPVPEPATLLLLGVGLVGLAGFGRKKLIKYK